MVLAYVLQFLGLVNGPTTKRPARQTSRSLRLEHLEARWVPATLTVGSGAQPYHTIQSALGAAHSGDTINVLPGTYYVNDTIGGLNIGSLLSPKNGIKLVGANPGNTFIVVGQTPGTSESATLSHDAMIDVFGQSAWIRNFTFDGKGNASMTIDSAIRIDSGSSATVINDNIRGLFNASIPDDSTSFVGYGVHVVGATATVVGNDIRGYHKSGVFVEGASGKATIQSNTITGAGATPVLEQYGVDVRSGASVTVQYNTIQNNLYDDGIPNGSSGAGVYVTQSSLSSTLSFNTLVGNQSGVLLQSAQHVNVLSNSVANSPSDAILLLDSSNNTIASNFLTHNGFDAPTGSGPGGGITLFDSNSNQITLNMVLGSTLDGIYLDNSNLNQVTNNLLWYNGGNGIYLTNGASNNLISSDDVRYNGGSGVVVEGATTKSNTLDHVTAYFNAFDGILLKKADSTLVRNSTAKNNGHVNFAQENDTNTTTNNNSF